MSTPIRGLDQRHIRDAAPPSSVGVTEQFPCSAPGCDRVLATSQLRADHVIEHHATTPSTTWGCRRPGCERVFATRSAREAHEDIGHRAAAPGPSRKDERAMTTTELCHCGKHLRHTGRHRGSRPNGGGPRVKQEDPKPTIVAVGPTKAPRTNVVDISPAHPAGAGDTTVAVAIAAGDLQLMLDHLGEVQVSGTVAEVADLPALRCYQILAGAITGSVPA